MENQQTPELDLTINTSDTSQLLLQLRRCPNMYYEWARYYETAKRKVADLKLQLKVRESSIAQTLRAENQKISEARIDKSYFEYEDYRVLNEELNKAKQTEGNLGAILRALEHKHSIMITVASLIKAELRQQI